MCVSLDKLEASPVRVYFLETGTVRPLQPLGAKIMDVGENNAGGIDWTETRSVQTLLALTSESVHLLDLAV